MTIDESAPFNDENEPATPNGELNGIEQLSLEKRADGYSAVYESLRATLEGEDPDHR